MKKQLSLNLITNLIAMVISLGINYLITPYVTKQLGIGAYSYVTIITNIISFFTVITYTLNSMVGRFYTIAYNESEKKSNQYISTAFFSCIALAIILFPVILFMTFNLDKIIIIDKELKKDVQFAFFISSMTFLLSTISSIMLTGTYAKNKLNINNTINIIANSLKGIVVFTLFYLFSAKIWFIGLGGLAQALLSIILGYICFKHFIPTVKFRIKFFKKEYAKELILAGLFNSVILLGNNLMTQVDLIVGNRFIFDTELLGKYSVVLLFSNTIRQIASALSSAFSPTTIKLYAQKKYDELVKYTNKAVSICSTILGWPVSIIASLLVAFVFVWLKQDFTQYQYLFIIMLMSLLPNMAISQLNVLNQAMNKLKVPAIASIIAGFLNIILAIIFVKVFEWGIYGIAIASIISLTLRNLIFAPIYASIITNQKCYIYYKPLLKSTGVSIITCILGILIRKIYLVKSLTDIIIVAIILSIEYLGITYCILNKNEKNELKGTINEIWKKKKLKN